MMKENLNDKDKIREIEVSSDTSVNLKKTQEYIQSVIVSKPELTKEDIKELIQIATEHFSFDESTKQKLIAYCQNVFLTEQSQRAEQKYQDEILMRVSSKKHINKIFPSIDYRKDTGMIYAITGYDEKGEQTTYVGNENKKIYEIEKAKEHGYILTHAENIDSRFSLELFAEYKNGKTVVASEVFIKIKDFLKQFIVISEQFYDVLVSYIMMTYIYIIFEVIPYLWINRRKRNRKKYNNENVKQIMF